jgi:hypothetical protein
MAQFTKVHGDFQPVVVFDQGVANTAGAGWSNGLNAFVPAVTVQPQGPKLDYFTLTSGGSFSTTDVANLVAGIQQLATVYLYQVNTSGTDTFGFACYPAGAWTTASLADYFDGSNASPDIASAAIGATFLGDGEA